MRRTSIASTALYRELFISHEDWLLEVEYESGDRQFITAPNVKTLEDMRNQIHYRADDVKSAVIARVKS